MNADTKEPKKDAKKESRKDDGKKPGPTDDESASRALSAIAGALARSRDSDDATTTREPDIVEVRRPGGSLSGGPSDAAAHALSAIARKHALIGDAASPPTSGAARTVPAQARRRSLYERIVENEDDLAGLVAYALSKQRKRDWHAAFSAETGRAPREDEAYAFLLGEGTDKQLRTYRQQAVSILRLHTESVSIEERPEVLLAALEAKVKSTLHWWKFIPAAIFGAAAFIVLLAGIIYLLPSLGIDPGFILSLTAT